ncbi:2-oxoglutarate ferredoxin oxidoreductase subunit delta [Desulfobaculum xiamenense]|uniref:2-oxoglutarate ferredoxin oxidoreductase subunit delta n=1 Tax=Desulfobaculum xiamenense TaxID=995050 RepID=A0A846QS20_9BACT|nr:4Fe-4S dicluster domain-containing protein [Desulfobaculum xiamenense]NJB67974.1 2-oxoglutarate ferredoxin oxidoreductase subunit delta [Desulfobaculum xiamenense]
MSRIEIREERCKGCLLCTTVCPKGIIQQSDRFNKQGYKVVEVPLEKMEECTGCASCAKICPDFCITVYKTPKHKDEE